MGGDPRPTATLTAGPGTTPAVDREDESRCAPTPGAADQLPRRRSRPDSRRPECRQGRAVPARTGKAPTGWKPAPANSKPASNGAQPNSTPKRNSPHDHQPWSALRSSSLPASSPDPSPPTPRRRLESSAARSMPHWPPNAHWVGSQSRCHTTTLGTTFTPPPPKGTRFSSKSRAASPARGLHHHPQRSPLGKNVPAAHRLVMVEVSPDGPGA